MEQEQQTGFEFDGISITGYIDVSSKTDVAMMQDLGLPADTVTRERRRVAIPLEDIGPHYEGAAASGEPTVVVWAGGNDWHLWGSYDDFRALLARARNERDMHEKMISHI